MRNELEKEKSANSLLPEALLLLLNVALVSSAKDGVQCVLHISKILSQNQGTALCHWSSFLQFLERAEGW
jgi:hypothetical protein